MRMQRTNVEPSSRSLLLVAVALSVFGAMGANCPVGLTGGEPEPSADAGSPGDDNLIVCSEIADCPADGNNWVCRGFCVQTCADDFACPLTHYCGDGECRVGCRDSLGCEDDEVCANGSCISRDGQESCGDRCDCASGEACIDGICAAPPSSCSANADCPHAPGEECGTVVCNGATHQCVWTNPGPCADNSECALRQGCEGGCSCTSDGSCIPASACTVESEAEVCGFGYYCDPDSNCAPSPPCSAGGTECDALGLFCNESIGQCQRDVTCTSSADCSAPTNQCNTALGVCEVPDCINGGVPCGTGFTCNQQTGDCDFEGGGTTCMSNGACSAALWPNSEWCYIAPGAAEGNCITGCQGNHSCPVGWVCTPNQTGDRVCVDNTPVGGGDGDGDGDGDGGTGSKPAGESCTGPGECLPSLICEINFFTMEGTCGYENYTQQADEPCESGILAADCIDGLTCGTLSGICREDCEDSAGDACDPATDATCCVLTGRDYCVADFLGFGHWCEVAP